MHRGGVRGSSLGTGPSLPRRAGRTWAAPGVGAAVTWHHRSVPRCLCRCAPAVELGAQRADGERQMELVLCDVVPAWLFGVGWRVVGTEEVGREAPVSGGDGGRTRRTPAPSQDLAVLPTPRPPSLGSRRFCWAFTRAYPRSRRERVLPRGLQGDPCSLSRFVVSGK